MTDELKQKLIEFLSDVYFVQDDWADLGWDMDGTPDNDLCDDFESKLIKLKFEARKLQEEIGKN